jgi:hypothetical protein
MNTDKYINHQERVNGYYKVSSNQYFYFWEIDNKGKILRKIGVDSNNKIVHKFSDKANEWS